MYKCNICGREFDSKRGLSLHITKSHKDEKEELEKVVGNLKKAADKVYKDTHEIIKIYAFNDKEKKMKELWILKLNRDELKHNGFRIPLIVKAKNE
ncbi:MAG: C2H2-type zinc finger protein [Candidatus Cloacimonetes bacterium]|nr:C2H2-type zinc finger protein [Candidatus Cloacimonadota bacterium]